MASHSLEIKDITKRFGEFVALNGVSLDVEPGEFMTLLGPSGCGKSTLLRLIAGLESQTGGTINVGGQPIDGLRPKERGVAMVFQNYALYPHMSVYDNIAMPLVMQSLSFARRFPGVGRLFPGSRAVHREIAKTVEATARLLEIESLLARRPGQLSGGQRQRVALGRAMVREPSVFLMDEPLSNLDARLRIQMRNELTDLHRKLGTTFIYVTHDQVEAMTMSSRIAVMMDGEIVQLGAPAEIYARPGDLRVAKFIGASPINTFQGHVGSDGRPVLLDRALPMRIGNPGSAGKITIAIRPEDVTIADDGDTDHESLFRARPVRIEDHGADLIVHLMLENMDSAVLSARIPAGRRPVIEKIRAADDGLAIVFPPDCLHIFNEVGVRLDIGAQAAPALAGGRK